MSNPNNLTMLELQTKLRQVAAIDVLKDIGALLVHIDSPESGRIAESIFQLLPDKKFSKVCAVIVNNESDDISKEFSFAIVALVAQKVGVELTSENMMLNAANNVVSLINCENLRRKGCLDYLWTSNIFAEEIKEPYAQLTEKGKTEAQKFVLDMYHGKSVQ